MTKQEILESLCWYDERNPYYDIECAIDREPRKDCYCDNCFYGRDKLAVELLTKLEVEK